MMRRLRGIWSTLVHADRLDRELDDEIECSVQIVAARLVRAGLDTGRARAAAERIFAGPDGVERVREAVRRARPGSALRRLRLRFPARSTAKVPDSASFEGPLRFHTEDSRRCTSLSAGE